MSLAPVFIFSSMDNDPHASAVAWALRQNGVDCRLFPSIRGDGSARISIRLDGMGEHTCLDDGDFSDVRSVWCRRPKFPPAGKCLPADRGFIEGQWKFLQKNLFDLSSCYPRSFWVNAPRAADLAESKLVQLQAARMAGFNIPETVFSNHLPDVASLIRQWGRVVFKTFYPQSWRSEGSGRTYTMSVVMLDGDSSLPESAVAMSPGIYQRYIDKICDLRITVIGEKLFAAKICKTNGTAFFDWRENYCEDDICYEVFPLGAVLEGKIREVMRRLGIVFGCIDLVVDAQGEVYFLEVNQAGQFLFVEQAIPEFPLLQAMTAMLCAGRPDYGVEDAVAIHFSDYLASEDFQRINVSREHNGQHIASES